jgi:hypothetical protein
MNGSTEVVLSRKIDTQTVVAIMTVREFNDQEEIFAVLKLFNIGERITKETVNSELLFMPPDSPYGLNVLKAVEEYGLIKESMEGLFELTPAGKDALEREKIPIPMRGVYRVVLSNDPLLQCKILDIEPMESKEDDGKMNNFEKELPETAVEMIDNVLNRTINLAISDLRPVIVAEWDRQGYYLKTPGNVTISLRLTTDGDVSLKLAGKKEVSLKPPEDIERFNTVKQILGNSGSLTLVDGTEVLLIEVKDLTVNEIRSFSKSFKIEKPSIYRHGGFDPVVIQNIRIMPINEREALLWASKLLLMNIDRYVGESEYNAIVQSTAKSFEPLYSERFIRENLSSYSEALRKTKERNDQYMDAYWYLMAPYDLSAGVR